MPETTGCSPDWHLEHSRPALFLDYFNPRTSFAAQANTLATRFRDIQALCNEGENPPELTRLRNELAFHLVKMSRWWGFDFCPRGVTDVRNPLFMTYVKAHIEHSIEDESLFDLLTVQRHMHAGDAGHLLVLGQETGADPELSVLFGIDGQRGFRFAIGSTGLAPLWNGQTYPDFASMWLSARAVHALIADSHANVQEYESAHQEHIWARAWHRRHFHRHITRPAVDMYAQAMSQLDSCQSIFGRAEFETIVNRAAFHIARTAFDHNMTIADMIGTGGLRDMGLRHANTIKRRARTYITTCIDPIARPEMDILLDRVISYLPRRCT
ncbi:hypothetical protein K6L44_12780 [Gluconacetobacter entanii]|uniref:hypothetical protein n=1 Tax=Gluconacetobacter entanii TaxID=108528 RepID=UPI001C93435B|nr:hypothetical protein [Gluconacetobacter entanii]MBY4640840.1 hypothetical protein [Gluconacetobacter entanii]MCW4581844.1 hypothetical protein [Gluconacetobacter entanii]MCW4585415.1 hypothetical protein [Gluconacetobacter entanii]MCW4588990.1 hypothetical protein [Gluconacetobacter entanii]